MTHLPWLIFVTLIGACVGSFLNVVIYRLPAGLSIVHPPSACPKCQHRLAWYDNVPVLGWLWLRGRCRYCANRISAQYPIIEAVTAVLFGGLFYVLYMTDLRPDFSFAGPGTTAVILAAYLVLIGALVAATLIDARLYIIPLEIPWLVTAVGVVLLPLTVAIDPATVLKLELPPLEPGIWQADRLAEVAPHWQQSAAVQSAVMRGEPGPVVITAAPLASTGATAASIGGVLGLIVAILMLRRGYLSRSFEEDIPQPVEPDPERGEASQTATPDDWLAHPHPRREVLKECAFLAFPIAGAALAVLLVSSGEQWPIPLRVLGGTLLGYLLGGGIVWAVRVLGTLAFGKEAMGLGDVHLMAAVGAVCGWQVAVLAFFVAPFFGLIWAGASAGMATLLNQKVRVIPYGPHLAAGTLVVIVLREPLLSYFAAAGL